MFCYSCLFTNSILCQNIPDNFECFVMQIFITQISLSFHLVTLIIIHFFRPWYENFLNLRFFDREEELCYISDKIVIWVIVITAGLMFVSIKRCRKVLHKKLSKYSRSSGCSFCQIIVFALHRTNTTAFWS